MEWFFSERREAMKTEKLSLALVIIILLILMVLGTCCAHNPKNFLSMNSGEYRAFLYFKEVYFATKVGKADLEKEADWRQDWAKSPEDYAAFLKNKLPFMNVVEPTSKDLKFLTEQSELLELFWEWSKINPRHLTADQRDFFEHFRQWEKVRTIEEEKDDREFISAFPWIDPDQLSIRDKVFLSEAGSAIVYSM
ncbi:MAG: hypothetical protein AAB358_03090 [Patescibacteria group bacterium]